MTLRALLVIQFALIVFASLSGGPYQWWLIGEAIAAGSFGIWWEWKCQRDENRL